MKAVKSITATLGIALLIGLSACQKGERGEVGETSEAGEKGEASLATLCASSGPAIPESAIRDKLVAQGYSDIKSIGSEDGCVEAKGLDSAGKRFEVYINPTTGKIVHTK